MQEFFPQSRSSHTDESNELSESSIQRPTSWSNTSRTGDVTKNEHPSTFEEEPVPLYSYSAQDNHGPAKEQPPSGQKTNSTRSQQHFSPDGDALEDGYRPYQAPFWTRPQRQRKRFLQRWLVLVILIIVVVKLLPFLAALVLTLLGLGLFLIFVPILIILGFVVVIAGLVLFVLSKMGFPVWRNLFGRGRWSRSWRRGW